MLPQTGADDIDDRRTAPARPVRGGRRWVDDPEERAAHEWAMGDIGARIHAEREWRGLSLEELAKRTRQNPQSIADIENGRSDPNISTITRIFRAFSWYVRVLPEPMSSYQPRPVPVASHQSNRVNTPVASKT